MYYIFARSKANGFFKAGTSVSAVITTLATTNPDIIYCWLDNDVLVTSAGGVISIAIDTDLEITAQGNDYSILRWEVNGVIQTQGVDGKTFTFKRSAAGEYTIGLFIVKDGKLYSTDITVTVQDD
jgi:hypothetical protein